MEISFKRRHFYFAVVLLLCFFHVSANKQEADTVLFSGSAMGMQVAICRQWTPEDGTFQSLIASITNEYCRNLSLCNLKSMGGAKFGPENVMFVDNTPTFELTELSIRFVVIYPNKATFLREPRQPLVDKAILSAIITKYMQEISTSLNWKILSYEKTPRFDAVTEFMNIALLPLGIGAGLCMYAVAHCATLFSRIYTDTGSFHAAKAAQLKQDRIQAVWDMHVEFQGLAADDRRRSSVEKSDAVLLSVERLASVGQGSEEGDQPPPHSHEERRRKSAVMPAPQTGALRRGGAAPGIIGMLARKNRGQSQHRRRRAGGVNLMMKQLGGSRPNHAGL